MNHFIKYCTEIKELKKYKLINNNLKIENKHYSNKYTKIIMDKRNKTNFIKTKLLEIRNFIHNIQFDKDVFSIDKINDILNKIRDFSQICTFEELISLELTNNNVYETDERIFLPVAYELNKKKYEKYFNTKLEIDNEKDYFYAYCFSFFILSIFIVYDKINEVIPNILSKSIYNAMLAIDADNVIFEDKIDKGIIIKKITKNSDGEIINIEYEEIDGMYENIYGRKEK